MNSIGIVFNSLVYNLTAYPNPQNNLFTKNTVSFGDFILIPIPFG